MIRKVILIAGGLLVIVAGLAFAGYLVAGRNRLQAIDVTPGPVTTSTGTYEVRIQHGGRERTYYLYVPEAAVAAGPLALVLALHGGGGRARQMDDLTHITAIASREGFLVAFPAAVDKSWNDGRMGAGSTAEKENIDDAGFIRAVIEDAASKLPIDLRRVYATGISNGAIMASRLACEDADVIAAVGLVVGTAPQGFEERCRPARPVPVVAFLSTKDPLVPYGGGSIEALGGLVKRGKVVSAGELREFWAQSNGCAAAPLEEGLPDKTEADDSRVVRVSAASCAAGADVVFYRVEGAGHTWPGGKQYLSPWLVGTTNRDIDASELIWQFFASHPRP